IWARLRLHGYCRSTACCTAPAGAARIRATWGCRHRRRSNRDLSDRNTRRLAIDRSNDDKAIQSRPTRPMSIQAGGYRAIHRRRRSAMSSRSIHIVRPGLQTTVQDLGRWGYQALGVSVAGPMDPFSHRLANAMVGNAPNTATLEITITGPEIEFEDDCFVAIAGAEF